VLTNQQSGAAFRSVTNTIKDSYFGIKGKDRIKQYNENVLRNEKYSDSVVAEVWKNVEKVQKNGKTNTAVLSNYTGTYSDPWFGKVNIFMKNGKLRFEAEKAPDLHGQMSFYKGNTFVVKWDDRSLNGDAFSIFSLDREGKPEGFGMEPVSPMTDFSFNFHDLEFVRE